jgi:uncharacterized alpha/beta hydrolase family protein
MFRTLAPARRRLVLAVLALLAVVVVGLGAFFLVRRIGEWDRMAVDQGQPGPVPLVPGYGGSTGSLQTLATRLTQAGRDATVIDRPSDGDRRPQRVRCGSGRRG